MKLLSSEALKSFKLTYVDEAKARGKYSEAILIIITAELISLSP